MKKSAQKGNLLIPLLIILAVSIGILAIFKFKLNAPQLSQTQFQTKNNSQEQKASQGQLQQYTSEGLKITFNYPRGWYIEEQYPFILVSNFESSLHKDFQIDNDRIEVLISNFGGCHPTIEENLTDPACGEGGPSVPKNKIISKESRQTPGGTFYKYIVESPNDLFTYHLLEGQQNVLQIEKNPDPSQFEREFDEIINSIQFL